MASKKQTRKIIGLTGPKGSGKGTVAKYLAKNFGATIITGSDILNEILAMIGVSRTRLNQVALAQTLRKTFGADAMAIATRAALERLPTKKQRLGIIDGVRPRADWEYWRGKTNASLVAINAQPKTRYERLRKRGKTQEERTLTYERFLKEEKLPTETKTIRATSRLADFSINTNTSLSDVYRQIDSVARELKLQRIH